MVNFLEEPVNGNFNQIITDSRTNFIKDKAIFFAIKGANHDGHEYIVPLYKRGVRCFVVEAAAISEKFLKQWSGLNEAVFYKTDNAIAALQHLVAAHRKAFNYPVVGITGSNGKTIVKEWLGTLLNGKYNVVKSPKSYNSQLGVPLSVWQMSAQHSIGIFEAGISRVGEMEHLQKIIQPSIGIFTNIGTAHAEYFENLEQKIDEKLKLFMQADVLIYCADNSLLVQRVAKFCEKHATVKSLSWGMEAEADIRMKHDITDGKSILTYTADADSYSIVLPFTDAASLQNICHCIVLMRYLALDWNFIQQKIHWLKPVSMRLSLKEGIKNTQIIDDTYNNDLVGLQLALDFMYQHSKKQKKVCMLSDLLQTGEDEAVLYRHVSQLLNQYGIDTIIGVGATISRNLDQFKQQSFGFYSTQELIDNLAKLPLENSSILIKGARKFEFEHVVALLEARLHETRLEIHLDALTHNLNYFKNKLKPPTKIMAMVKAFAYGVGNVEVAQLMQFHGVDYLGVAYTDEGVLLRNEGLHVPIMVLNPTEAEFERLLQYNLEPEIYSLNRLKAFLSFMDGKAEMAKIHIKLDTGMHRLGLVAQDIDELIFLLKQTPNVLVASIFSHLAASENATHDGFTNSQVEKFQGWAKKISQAIGYSPIFHILNSSGIGRFPEYHFGMVRLGVGLYGVGYDEASNSQLKTVAVLKSHISQIKTIPAHETIGYGRWGKVDKHSKIATIAIGYADGYDRGFGRGQAHVLVNGVLCPTIGNICMDMCMVDISKATAQEGDEVIIFGENPSIFTLAAQIDTIPYEILTNVGERVKRVFLKE